MRRCRCRKARTGNRSIATAEENERSVFAQRKHQHLADEQRVVAARMPVHHARCEAGCRMFEKHHVRKSVDAGKARRKPALRLAREVAAQTCDEVKAALGLSYF